MRECLDQEPIRRVVYATDDGGWRRSTWVEVATVTRLAAVRSKSRRLWFSRPMSSSTSTTWWVESGRGAIHYSRSATPSARIEVSRKDLVVAITCSQANDPATAQVRL